ncbi:MAG: ribose-phosphate pyrophosphokinase [Spirochaetaceae bacterium]|jgi:ribose-phosphate pyrophosphokinase|nr:ribose-phosphate pyrophosphokinase [Spirochaetaceae bacterium]
MMTSSSIRLISGTSNRELSKGIADYLQLPLYEFDVVRFANDNLKIRINESVRGDDVFLIQTSQPPVNDILMETLQAIDALKHASAGRITAVLPYYPYVRSDKKDEPRISISARLIADLLQTAGADRILTMNLHSPQVQGFFSIPADHILARDIVIDYFKKKDLSNAVVVSPDAGSAKRAGVYARRLNLPLAIMDKRRFDDNDKAHIFHVIGEVGGKDALIFDDEISTAGSMLVAEKALRELGVNSIRAFAVHGVLVGPAVERLKNSSIDEVVTTNTITIDDSKKWDKLTILDVAPLFAEAISHIHTGDSLSSLFHD